MPTKSRRRHAHSASPYRGDYINMGYTGDSSSSSDSDQYRQAKPKVWYDSSDWSDYEWPTIPPVPVRAKSYQSLGRANYGLTPVYIPKVRHYSIESLSRAKKKHKHRHKSPSAKGKEFGSYYAREINEGYYPTTPYSTPPSPRYYGKKHSRSRPNSGCEQRERHDSEGSVEKELRLYTNTSKVEVAAAVPVTTTFATEDTWRRDEPRYIVPDPKYLARMAPGVRPKTALRRVEYTDTATDTKPEVAKTSSTTIPTTLKLSRKYEWPQELEWHRWIFNMSKLPGIVVITGAAILLTGVGTEPLSGAQLALVIIGFFAGAFILLSSLYCVIYPEHQTIARAKYLTYLRIIHSIGHIVFALLLISFGIWVFVRNRNGVDIGTYDTLRGDIGMLMTSAGGLLLILAIVAILLGFLAIDKLKFWLPFEDIQPAI